MTIGDRIKAYRREFGLTQSELAKTMGVSASMIGQYETGVRTPKYETLERIAKAMHTSVSALMGEENTVDAWSLAFDLQEKYQLSAETALCIVDDCISAFRPLFGNNDFADLLCYLNEEGKQTAYERVRELTEITRYQLQTAADDK